MEILVKKSYDFEKPEFIEHVLKQNIGDGLVLAKGDVHKVHRTPYKSLLVFLG